MILFCVINLFMSWRAYVPSLETPSGCRSMGDGGALLGGQRRVENLVKIKNLQGESSLKVEDGILVSSKSIISSSFARGKKNEQSKPIELPQVKQSRINETSLKFLEKPENLPNMRFSHPNSLKPTDSIGSLLVDSNSIDLQNSSKRPSSLKPTESLGVGLHPKGEEENFFVNRKEIKQAVPYVRKYGIN